jgi:hypothetical protein
MNIYILMGKMSWIKFQERIFDITFYASYALIILSYLGLSKYNPAFLDDINNYIRIYICLFLLWRFNPFRQVTKFTNLDRKIAFSAGLFILTTTVLNNYLNSFKHNISSRIGLVNSH